MPSTVLKARAAYTTDKIRVLEEKLLERTLTPERLRRACVYATGSVGRGEASQQSDLDVFILDLGLERRKDPDESLWRLSDIEQTEIKADLIRAARDAKFPEFSGDDEWLTVHRLDDMLQLLGTREDDARNLFTARLLMLLEGRCLVNRDVYETARERVVQEGYWRDYEGHESEFIPAMMANDICRFWKTLTLNYEAPRNLRPPEGEGAAAWVAKRRIANIKLGFSRLWICHSALAYLTWLVTQGPVTASSAIEMCKLTPSERLLRLRDERTDVSGRVDKLLSDYEWFLEATDKPKDQLITWVENDGLRADARRREREFGDDMYKLIADLNGDQGKLLRYLLV